MMKRKSSLTSIVDVDVLLPLVIRAHPAHSIARSWIDSVPDRGVGWCLPVKLGVLRLLCNPKVMGADVLAPVSALDVWKALAHDPRFTEVSRLPADHEAHLRGLVANRSPSPDLWSDAWLAALALCHGSELVTFDRGFRAFEQLNLRLLAIAQ